MSVTGETIRDIAQLARLQVSDEELPQMTERFNAVLDLFEALQAAATDDLEPMANPLDATQQLRADEVTATDERQALQSTAPVVEDGLYLVPRVVD